MGRHALLFARAGFSVTGFDLSEIALARLMELAAIERPEPLLFGAGGVISPRPRAPHRCTCCLALSRIAPISRSIAARRRR
ncbi:MAG: class I SAM-dependent methyltransferase [Rectinemataceae bacterium]